MDASNIIKSVVGVVVILIIITVVAIPIIGDMQSSTETVKVQGNGVTVDIMSSSVEIEDTMSGIYIDGQEYLKMRDNNEDDLMIISDSFVIFNQDQELAGYYGDSVFYGKSAEDFKIENGVLHYQGDVVSESTWCYAVVQGEVGEKAVFCGNSVGYGTWGKVGPVDYGGGTALFASLGGNGLRFVNVRTVDHDGSTDTLYGNGKTMISANVTPDVDSYSISVSYTAVGEVFSGLIGFLIVDSEYTVTTTNDDAAIEMIGLMPIIMVAGAVIATIGLFMRSRS